MQRLLGAMALALATTIASLAIADEPAPRTSSLSWVRLPGADACVSTQDLARDVERRLGRSVFVSAAAADVSVEGRIEAVRGGPGWRAVILLRDEHGALLGTREIVRKEASCDAMREPLALVIAVMIDPDAALTPATPAPPASAATAPPAAPPPVIIERQVPIIVNLPERRPDPVRLDVGAAVALNLGLLPAVGVGAFGGGLIDPPRFIALEGYGVVFANRDGQGGGATFSFAYVGGGLCPLRYHGPRLHVYACAAGQLGYLLREAAPGAPAQHQIHVAGALEGRATLRLVGPVTARLGLSFIVPILRDTFAYTQTNGAGGATGQFRMAPVAGTVDLGLGVVFP